MIIASEQVGKGHPDKIADQISDIVLQNTLNLDHNARVACETIITSSEVFVRGEVAFESNLSKNEYFKLLEEEIIIFLKDLNYKFDKNYQEFKIDINLVPQSVEINQAVEKNDEIAAGDQGIIFGFATNETKYFLPLPYILATLILKRMDDSIFSPPNYDSKSQVSFNYKTNKINHFLISLQHQENIDISELREFTRKEIKKLAMEFNLNDDFEILINPSGSFIVGGPKSDVGLTGRKIIADTYGGFARHGGGAFSGKDFSKVDRSAAYMLRYIAKNIVAHGLADKIEIQLSYAIGVRNPISIAIDTFGTNKKTEEYIINFIEGNFDLSPNGIRKALQLDNPNVIYYPQTSKYGHFISETKEIYPWERIIDKSKLVF